MKTVKLVCPSCSAEMEVDEEKLLLYCPYCGKKLQMSTEKGRDSKSMSRPGKTKKLAGKC